MFSLQICTDKTATPCRVGESSEHNWWASRNPRVLTKRSNDALRASFGACERAIAPSRISNDDAVGAWPEHRTATLRRNGNHAACFERRRRTRLVRPRPKALANQASVRELERSLAVWPMRQPQPFCVTGFRLGRPVPEVAPELVPPAKFKAEPPDEMPPSKPTLLPPPAPVPGAGQAPIMHETPPGQTTPAHGSTQVPSLQTVPLAQVTVAQAVSTHLPSLPQVSPAAQPAQLQSATHRPLSQTRLAGQVTPAQGSTH
jgi:hypothetical protein